MIKLFSIPNYSINTSDHILHGKVVKQFEEQFCEYIGAKHGCSTNSATSAIFLCLTMFPEESRLIRIPSIIPPVVLNAILMAKHDFIFIDIIDWVGSSYIFHTYKDGSKIIDSAQKVNKDQFKKEAKDDDLMIFSFYPTKPIASCDGGMIVSNNKEKIELLRTASLNGMVHSNNSWERVPIFPGYKMYMNSIQAAIALEELNNIHKKNKILEDIRNYYNGFFKLANTSYHLYRIEVDNTECFVNYMKTKDIQCGRHYIPTHLMPLYEKHISLPLSEEIGRTTVSLPFHKELTEQQMKYITGAFSEYECQNNKGI